MLVAVKEEDLEKLLANAEEINKIYTTPYGKDISVSSLVNEIFLLNEQNLDILKGIQYLRRENNG